MAEQIQCPNCGGYRVSQSVQHEDVETGKYSPIGTPMRILWVLGFLWFIFCSLWVLGLPLLAFLSKKTREDFFIDPIINGVRKEKTRVTSIYSYRCEICGYRWKWDIRDPKPEVIVRPDLIAKGVKKLEEEEEERRRRQADDDWYRRQRQQNEKK